MLRAILALLVLTNPAALATDVLATVRGSIHDAPVDGNGDTFNSSPFEGLIRRVSTTQEDRAIQEFDVAASGGQPVIAATLSGIVSVNNAFDNGVRSFEFVLYAGNGTADLGDYSIAGVVAGTGSYHPPMQSSFAYSFDVTSQVSALLGGGATWIGLRAQATSTPNFPNVLDDGMSILSIDVSPTAGTPFCFGDGSATACPCGKASTPGADQGCLSSIGTGGTLRGDGAASVTNDTFTLRGALMPNSSALYFQGTTDLVGGLGAVFGDGVRCAAGTVIRLGTKSNSAGASQYPSAGDPPVSVRGLVPAGGGQRYYQIWYRNAAAFCTVSTFNLTNGLSVTWTA
jgi:hypothetical protein